jgi:hypothetical protein
VAKRDGTTVRTDFTLPVLNNDIISFSVEKQQHNHQSHYKAEAEGGDGKRKGARRTQSSLLNLQTVPGIQPEHKNTHCSEVYIYNGITTV